MSAIHDLLGQITDASLRGRIAQEVDKLADQKKFGLVFEDHVPECTPLYGLKIKRGSVVASKDGTINDPFIVEKIEGNVVICQHIASGDTATFNIDELVVVARFGEPVYPYLQPRDVVMNAPEDNLWHTLIEADNFHALQLLDYLYRGKVDCIYIDPPYNTGARDWKYNNDYVDASDAYRHSKWLSMMDKRLRLAKRLLNPEDSVLIITIDEKEYLHLGCLLEEMFPGANIQMVTTVISGKGVSREGQFSRVEEYIFFVTQGNMQVTQLEKNMLNEFIDDKKLKNPIEFLGFRRRNKGNFRTSRPNQFYPVIVDNQDGHIVCIGDAITPDIDKKDVPIPDGCTALWPLDPLGAEKIWSLVPDSARILLSKGCLKVVNWNPLKKVGSVKYLASGTVDKIDEGTIIVDERDKYGNIISGHIINEENTKLRPRRVWNLQSHNASSFGTLLLKKFLVTKRFDFPKSLYAVHDALRFFLANKPNALIIDFFAGSGTTLHAVNLLNKEDGSKRRCIMVTNNEVSEEEARTLTAQGFRQGSKEWEQLGIARYVTWPRTFCSVKGIDVNGNAIKGNYLTYMTKKKANKRKINQLSITIPEGIEGKKLKQQIVGLVGKEKIPQSKVTNDCPYIIAENHPTTFLFDDTKFIDWLDELDGQEQVMEIYVLTNDNKLFQEIKKKVEEMLGDYITEEPVTYPIQDGFKTNVEYFKLDFLDKNMITLGTQLKEILPLLWMKAGAVGKRPTFDNSTETSMLILPENRFAILIQTGEFEEYVKQLSENKEIVTAYIVTDSASGFNEMANVLQGLTVYQLYRDYLDNFRINYKR